MHYAIVEDRTEDQEYLSGLIRAGSSPHKPSSLA